MTATGFTSKNTGFTSLIGLNTNDPVVNLLATSLWTDLIAHGFTLVITDQANTSFNSITTAVYLQPDTTVDPLITSNPWAIAFRVTDAMSAYGTTAEASITTGTGASAQTQTFPDTELQFAIFNPAVLPPSHFQAEISPTNTSPVLDWFPVLPGRMIFGSDPADNLKIANNPRIWASNPFSYVLTIVPRGFVFHLYPTLASESFVLSSTMVIQRGMNCSGVMTATGYLPLFMLTNVTPLQLTAPYYAGADGNSTLHSNKQLLTYVNAGPQPTWYYNVIREVDSSNSYPNFDRFGFATTDYIHEWDNYWGNTNQLYMSLWQSNVSDNLERNGAMMHRIPVTWGPTMPVTTDTGEYLLLFPSGLCTKRFTYAEELDLIAISKASAYQSGQSIPLTVYSSDNRTYLACSSNTVEFGAAAAIRVFILIGGVDFH
jgi:hypothetical protein